MAIVLHHSPAKGTDKVILLGIANHDGDGGSWPSVKTLAKYANIDERGVNKALARLEASGQITRHIQQGGTLATRAGQRTNMYVINLACPPDCDRTAAHRVTPPDTPKTTPVPQDRGVREDRGTPVPQDRGTPVPQDTRTILEPSSEPSGKNSRAADAAPATPDLIAELDAIAACTLCDDAGHIHGTSQDCTHDDPDVIDAVIVDEAPSKAVATTSKPAGAVQASGKHDAAVKREESRPDVARVLDEIERQIVANGHRAPGRTRQHFDAVRLMLDKDTLGGEPMTPERIIQALRWASEDDFWAGVIKTPAGLRRNLAKMFEKASEQAASAPSGVPAARDGYGSMSPLRKRYQARVEMDAQIAAVRERDAGIDWDSMSADEEVAIRLRMAGLD